MHSGHVLISKSSTRALLICCFYLFDPTEWTVYFYLFNCTKRFNHLPLFLFWWNKQKILVNSDFFSSAVCLLSQLIECFVVSHSETPRNLVAFLSSGKGLHKLLSSLMKNKEDWRAGSRHWVLDKVICLHCDRHRGRQRRGRKKEWGFNTVLPLVTLVSSTTDTQVWSELHWTFKTENKETEYLSAETFKLFLS